MTLARRRARSGDRSGHGARTGARHGGLVRPRPDHGAVTAETAIAIPSLLVLLMILVWILVVVTAQLRVVDAARAGARAAARGESAAQAAAVAEQIAPAGAAALISRSGDEVRVEVRVQVRPPGGIPVLPSVMVDAVAYAAAEDAVGGDGRIGAGAPEPFGTDQAPRRDVDAPGWGEDP